jgi:hypothetical protein
MKRMDGMLLTKARQDLAKSIVAFTLQLPGRVICGRLTREAHYAGYV